MKLLCFSYGADGVSVGCFFGVACVLIGVATVVGMVVGMAVGMAVGMGVGVRQTLAVGEMGMGVRRMVAVGGKGVGVKLAPSPVRFFFSVG